jgi:membrane protease YdiL (CAAX protease family)
LNWKKINLYILIAFGISWITFAVLNFLPIHFSTVTQTFIIACLYMPGPAIATLIIQKLIYKQSLKEYGWSFDSKAIKWIFFVPLIYLALILLTLSAIGLLGNTSAIPQFGQLDFSEPGFNVRFTEMLETAGAIGTTKLPTIPPLLIFFLSIIGAVIAGATINLPFMFGEEFGWRGLLYRETQKLGFLRSSVFIGIVWGLWHLPLIVLSGLNYPEHPYSGILMMCLFTVALSPVFSYVRFKTKSILGPCMLHGMINATGTLFLLYVANFHELYSSFAGWAGIIASSIIVAGIYIFDKKFIKEFGELTQENTLVEEQTGREFV